MMEGGVKDRNLWEFLTEDLLHGANPLDVVGVVEWGQLDAILDSFQHLVGDDNRLAKQFAAMNHTMPGGMDIGGALDFCDSRSVGRDPTDQVLQSPRNIGERSRKLLPGSVARLHGNDRFSADSFNQTATQALISVLLNLLKVARNHLKL
jgi:hypothetical protein